MYVALNLYLINNLRVHIINNELLIQPTSPPQATSAALANLYIYNSVHSQGNTNPSARSRTSIPLHMYTFTLRTSAHTARCLCIGVLISEK